jgi:hypothetical protein
MWQESRIQDRQANSRKEKRSPAGADNAWF